MQHPVQVRAIDFTVGAKRLLTDVSLDVPAGTLCAVVGPSGAGKSTLLKLLCGIKRPSRGRAVLLGQDTAQQHCSHPIGYVPQDDTIHRALTIERVLHYAAQLRLPLLSNEQQQHRGATVLDLLQLTERRGLRVRRLSGGQRKRVSIGVELLAEPQVLFLDEPTSGLDHALERQPMVLLHRLAQNGRTVVLTTHVMETMDVVDQLVVIHQGCLAFAGPPEGALDFFRVERLRHLF